MNKRTVSLGKIYGGFWSIGVSLNTTLKATEVEERYLRQVLSRGRLDTKTVLQREGKKLRFLKPVFIAVYSEDLLQALHIFTSKGMKVEVGTEYAL